MQIIPTNCNRKVWNMNKITIFILSCLLPILIFIGACKTKSKVKNPNIEVITDTSVQDSLFRQLSSLAGISIEKSQLGDSLAFFVMPIEATCPSCRKKAVDSISKHQSHLDRRRFIILSGMGADIIFSYFTERGHKLPVSTQNIVIDSTNEAFVRDLVYTTPVIFYSYNHRVYQKVYCVPNNIKLALHEFFLSHHN